LNGGFLQAWHTLNRKLDETVDEQDFLAVLEAVEVTDAISLPDLRVRFLKYALSLCRVPEGKIISVVSVRAAEYLELGLGGPEPRWEGDSAAIDGD